MKKLKPTIACFLRNYLPFSETFIYDEITNIKNFHLIILTEKITDRVNFPYSEIYTLPEKPFFKKIQSTSLLQNILIKNKVKLVHARFGWSGIRIRKLCKKLNIPLITTFYGIDASRLPRHFFYRHNLKKLFQDGKIFLVQSNNMRDDIIRLGCPEEKVIVLYGGVDLKKFKLKKRVKKEKIKIIMCGRFVEKKGFEYGIRAFAKIAKDHKNTLMYIIGDGKLREKLKELTISLNISSKIKFLGVLPHREVQKQMEESDIFLAPSITAKNGDKEGIPTVIKEAMATGLPVISTYHAGIPELVKDGETGFLVTEKDVEAITEKISYLITHPDIAILMGEKGRKVVEEKFNLFIQMKKLERLYSRLINNND